MKESVNEATNRLIEVISYEAINRCNITIEVDEDGRHVAECCLVVF